MKRMWMWGLLAAGLSISPAAQAQYETGFEAPTYTANMDLNGQDEFFNPVPATSISFTVNLYSDNPLGIPAPPTGGGEQFALGTGPAGNPLVFARSQRPAPYGDGTGVWTVAYDIYVTFTGTLPTAQNVGSFSTQDFVVPNGDRTCIMLTTWTDPNTAATWDADMVWFNAANTQLQEKMPNTGFQNLAVNHWYRRWMTTDLDTNQVTEVGITDLTTNVSVVHNPTDRYLFGGSAGGPPPPDGFRLFAGGSVAGNTMAFDNVSISQPGPGCPDDGCGRFKNLACKGPDKFKVIAKGTGTPDATIELVLDGETHCVTVNGRGKWKHSIKNAPGEHTATACGDTKTCSH